MTATLFLLGFAGLVLAVLGKIAIALLANEVRASLPLLSAAIVRRAVRRLPPEHRERWLSEALADLEWLENRPLAGLVHAIGMWRTARRLEAELSAEPSNHESPVISSGDSRPRVFISYPHAARKQADSLARGLRDTYRIERNRHPPDRGSIGDLITRSIRSADIFIAVWDEGAYWSFGNPGEGISPWLLIEYTAAKAYGVPIRIARSDTLDEAVWRELDRETPMLAYSEATFASETVPAIRRWCDSLTSERASTPLAEPASPAR
jgi:hypothetical protein